MAQAVYEEHPLEKYLNELGEGAMTMPGGSTSFLPEEDELNALYDVDGIRQEPSWLLDVFEILSNLFGTSRFSQQPNPFVERFKYDVISSSLLSSSLSAAHGSRRPLSPAIPGHLRHRSRTPSRESNTAPRKDVPWPSNNSNSPIMEALSRQSSSVLAVAALAFGSGYYVIALIVVAAMTWIQMNIDGTVKPDMTPTVQSLENLISASNIWDSVVHDAISLLETEERSVFYGPTTPSSPLSHLRVSLNSTLHTTQTQCDNIRQLLSALTSPSELPQLSEMYAPPSPTKSTVDLDHEPLSPRPLSLPISQASPRQRTSSTPSAVSNKRSTWNGSYASLAVAGSPPNHLLRRREKRRSDLTSILRASLSEKSFSAPSTPSAGTRLSGVKEEDSDDEPSPVELTSPNYVTFGKAAQDLRRKRRSAGMEALGFSSHHGSPRLSPTTLTSGSRFTALHTTRHPLSLSALSLALQGAMSSKRYTCSHLLALRFTEEEDEGYWEDVRSVMALLMTTFADASARLTEALDEVEAQRAKDQTPTPESQSRRTSYILTEGFSKDSSAGPSTPSTSFAPMPSQLSRFAQHVESISAALTDAREHMLECVAALKEGPQEQTLPSSPSDDLESFTGPPALQAYERLRRELGLALRECERGRERLLDIVSPRKHSRDFDSEELPALGQDHGSDSDKAESTFPPDEEAGGHPLNLSILSHNDDDTSGVADDATSHLLLAASSKPPIGAEQVFESESGNAPVFSRERSKLSREERIKLAKAKRESLGSKGAVSVGLGMSVDEESSSMGVEKWGPGGDVVQELKDVIWKVGEKRRKMVATAAESQQQHDTPPPPIRMQPLLSPMLLDSCAQPNPSEFTLESQ
ncbi:hypothetical protein ONZ45_g5358 [Pleurotus djamor]|nr:hypothetical protein ONZ45_g5358 [Pleurotus djamor]